MVEISQLNAKPWIEVFVKLTAVEIQLELVTELRKELRIASIQEVRVVPFEDNPKAFNIYITFTPTDSIDQVYVSFVLPYYQPSPDTTAIVNELQTSSTKDKVYSEYTIYNITGVFSVNDTNNTGTNYFTGGSILENAITLGNPLPANNTPVLITYSTLQTKHLGLSVSAVNAETIAVSGIVTELTLALPIYDVTGIWDIADTNKSRINYYLGGSFTGSTITLGTPISYLSSVTVDYLTYIKSTT